MLQHRLLRYWKGILLLTLTGGGWLALAGAHPHSSHIPPQPAIPVEVQSALTTTLPVQIDAMGELVAARRIDLTPEVSGHVAAVFSEDGGVPVQHGTVVIQLDDLATRARLTGAKAALTYSEADYRRKAKLARQGVVSRQAIDQALAELKAREAEVQSTQASLDAMRLQAPFDGVLGRMNATAGDYVTAGQKLVALTDISHVRVHYTVPERYFSKLKPGQSVTVSTNAWPEKTFTGKVTFVSPTINPGDRTITLYADIPNTERLLTAGLFVELRQMLGATQNALVVPPSSLMPTMEGQVVFRVKSGKAERIPVTVVRRSQDLVQVRGKLLPGDQIVVAGQTRLQDGSRVEVVKRS